MLRSQRGGGLKVQSGSPELPSQKLLEIMGDHALVLYTVSNAESSSGSTQETA